VYSFQFSRHSVPLQGQVAGHAACLKSGVADRPQCGSVSDQFHCLRLFWYRANSTQRSTPTCLLHSGQWGAHWHNSVAMAITLSNNLRGPIVLLVSGSLSASLFTQDKLRGDATNKPWYSHVRVRIHQKISRSRQSSFGRERPFQRQEISIRKINCCTKIGK
jgi:hypothetical protein